VPSKRITPTNARRSLVFIATFLVDDAESLPTQSRIFVPARRRQAMTNPPDKRGRFRIKSKVVYEIYDRVEEKTIAREVEFPAMEHIDPDDALKHRCYLTISTDGNVMTAIFKDQPDDEPQKS
jgi:hypothetical protein